MLHALLVQALAMAALLAPVSEAVGTCGAPLLGQNFDKYTALQKYNQSNVVVDFPRVLIDESIKVNQCTVEDGRLKAHYPKGKILGQDTGCTWLSRFSQGQSEVTLHYDVYFEPGFEWTKGGKLPGLCGGTCPRGCDTATVSRGWSARLMWHQGGSIALYAYYPGMSTKNCGIDFFWNQRLTTGRWHQIRLYVKMNTPGVRNGVARGYLNGKLALNLNNFLWRDAAATSYELIDSAYITTYVGGSSVELFAPHHDQWAMFDSFKAWTGFCPPGTGFPPGPPNLGVPPRPTPGPRPAPPPAASCAQRWYQCGGLGYTGPRCCRAGTFCQTINRWYSRCL